MDQQTKQCQNCKNKFTIEPDDFDFYEKIKVPPPTFCPECRIRRRFAFLNERNLYHRICDLCKKNIISYISPDKKYSVYCPSCWWSDNWDASVHAKEFDPNVPLIKQIRVLTELVPQISLSVDALTLVNSKYVNYCGHLKNCYFAFVADYCENVLFSTIIAHDKDLVDCTVLSNSELCYECFNCQRCSMVMFSEDCKDCYNMLFSKNCFGCNNCFGCVNLRNKQYYIFNKAYSKDDYHKRLNKIFDFSYSAIQKYKVEARQHWLSFPNKYAHILKAINSSGDYVYFSKNAKNMYQAEYVEDGRYCQFITVKSAKDVYDYTEYGNNASLIYECVSVGEGVENIRFGFQCWPYCKDIEYSIWTITSSNMFGCVGLKNKQYCILNKQYSKQEYEKLVPKIIQHMNDMPYKDKKGKVYRYGEFFPPELSPFAYNETIAQEYFPLTREQVIKQGYQWKDPEKKDYEVTIKSEQLPDNIKDVKDNILKQIIGCEHQGKCNEQCTTAFKIIPQELQFYKKMKLPLPHLCPNCRHYQRLKQKNSLKLWHRKCQCAGDKSDNKIYKNTISHFHKSDHCLNEFQTTYAPDRKEIVYCESCYQQEVV